MTNLRTHRLVAILAALTLTTAACSSSADNNVTADTVDDVAAITAVTELTTTAPTTTTPAMEDAMEEPTTTTAPTTNPTTDADAGTADITASQDTEDTEDTDSFEAWRRDRLAQKEADEDAYLAWVSDNAIELDVVADFPAKSRHPDSVLPDSAYLDHDAIRALFPECPPPLPEVDWRIEHSAFWGRLWENWDSETVTLSGERVLPSGKEKTVVSGWWTDEQLEMYLPGGWINESNVRDIAKYIRGYEVIDFISEEPPPDWKWPDVTYNPGVADDGSISMETLYSRILGAGFVENDNGAYLLEFVRPEDLAGYNTTTDTYELGGLMQDWVTLRIQEPPIDKEPTAWGVDTLLKTRRAACVAQRMLSTCNGTREIDSPLLEPSHRIGNVLRSLVCEFEN